MIIDIFFIVIIIFVGVSTYLNLNNLNISNTQKYNVDNISNTQKYNVDNIIKNNSIKDNSIKDNSSKDNSIKDNSIKQTDKFTSNNVVEDVNMDNFLKKRDEDVVYDPLIAPEQRVEKRQYPKMKIYEHTRGEPDDYQLMGVLYNNTINKTYQLFGRRTYPGSSVLEYYYRGKDVGGLDYKFPLPNNKEIYDNEQIYVPTDKNIFTAKIYNFDRPRYIPYI